MQQELDFRLATPDPDSAEIYQDSIAPIFDAGLADIVEPDAEVGFGLRLAPTPGHTPGHTSLWIESDGGSALITGDVIHHPLQCAEPAVAFVSDHDAEHARATRQALLAAAAESGVLMLGTHFPTRPAGTVVAEAGAWRFNPLN